jgi:hypothetical protein
MKTQFITFNLFDLCSYYLLTDNCPDSVREKLTKFFNLDNH